MAVKFKLIKRGNPSQKDAPKRWHAASHCSKSLDGKTIAVLATKNTSTSPYEMEASMGLLAEFIPSQLQQGNSVTIKGLGTFLITFGSKGVDDISTFNASQMINNVRIRFIPAKEFRKNVLDGLKFVNAGVLDEEVNYASLTDYKKAKGLIDPGEEDRPVIE